MPEIKKGETKKQYMDRCIPYCISKEGLNQEQAEAKCSGMFDEHKEKGTQYEEKGEFKEYTFECSLHIVEMNASLTTTLNDKTQPIKSKEGWETFRAVAVVGDRMMKNTYVPYEALKEAIDGWNGTYHDLNHMGTSYPDTKYPFIRQNIDYIVGYQNNALANDETKEISMDVNISKSSPKYASWKSFVEINKEAGKIPNVSMSIVARSKRVKAKDLNFDALPQGYKPNDMVECLYDIHPKALTTCIEGVCNDSQGCGLAVNNECNECKCKDGKCNDKKSPIIGDDEDAKELAELKKQIEKLKEEK